MIEASEYKCVPRLKNWYVKIDGMGICKKYFDLPKRELLVIELSEKNVFTDIIFSLLCLHVMGAIPLIMNPILLKNVLCRLRKYRGII